LGTWTPPSTPLVSITFPPPQASLGYPPAFPTASTQGRSGLEGRERAENGTSAEVAPPGIHGYQNHHVPSPGRGDIDFFLLLQFKKGTYLNPPPWYPPSSNTSSAPYPPPFFSQTKNFSFFSRERERNKNTPKKTTSKNYQKR